MRLLAEVLHFEARIGCSAHESAVLLDAWVRDQRDVDSVIPVSACIQQFDLTAASFCATISQSGLPATMQLYTENVALLRVALL